MSVAAAPPRRAGHLRRAFNAVLVLSGVVLAVAVVNDLGRQVAGIRDMRADTAVFSRWSRAIGGPAAFGRLRMVHHGRRTDLVCAAARSRRGRICLAVARGAGGAHVIGAVRVRPGRHLPRGGRLTCTRPAEAAGDCVVGPGAAKPASVRL
jgi:hypothetical protein